MKAETRRACRQMRFVAVSTIALTGTYAHAQQVSGGDEMRSGEIVVTANKREQGINDVGMAIAAISGDILKEKGLSSLEDIAGNVPGLSFARSPTNTPILTLRGVGFNEETLGVYPAVSAYIDEAPLPFPVMASLAAYDLERVEVLKGPQGTLFGQNATGGAINYIAAKPTSEFKAGADLGYGRFNSVEGNAFVSGPISDTLRGRFAINGKNSDGWQRNFRTGEVNGSQSYIAARALVDWEPSDRLRIALNVNGWRDKSDPIAQQLIAVSPNNPNFASVAVKNAEFVPESNRLADWSITPRANRRLYQGIARLDFDMTENITFTSLSSYINYKQNQSTDSDGSVIRSIDTISDYGKAKTFNQEVRLSNDPKSPFRWVIGANYENSKVFENLDFSFFDGSANNPNNFYINEVLVDSRQRIKNYAVFSNLEYDISDITFIAGIRYTKSKNSAYTCNRDPGDGRYIATFNRLGTLLGQVPFEPIGFGDCTALNYDLVPGSPYQRNLNEDNVSWKLGVNYHVSSDDLVYATISRGYKAGSFPILAASSHIQYEPVSQESVTAYEIGVKSSLMDRKLQINLSGFYYDYRDKQLRGKLVDPLFGLLNALVNVPKSRIYGFDGDINIKPINGLSVSGRVTYLNSKVIRYEGPNTVRVFDNFAGDPLPFAPKWSYGVDLDYRIKNLSSGGEPFFGISLNGRSASDAQPGGYRITLPERPFARSSVEYLNRMPAYATVDARAGFAADDSRWKVQIWGKNIFNKLYWTNVTSGSETISRFVGMPATYGVTFSFLLN